MFRMMLAALALLALAGCASRLGVNAQTPRSVSTHYDPLFHSAQEAAELAEAHCQSQGGLHAVETGRGLYRGLSSTSWSCVP